MSKAKAAKQERIGRRYMGDWPDFSTVEARRKLASRRTPYWRPLLWGRHIGYERRSGVAYWLARYRTNAGAYRRWRLGRADDGKSPDGKTVLSFEQATALAMEWFKSGAELGNCRPLGERDELSYCPVGSVFTIGHAMLDFIDWKRVSSSRSHFLAMVSLINYHILPRVGTTAAAEFTNDRLTLFARDVLESPPKRGNQPPGSRRDISTLTDEDLRTRKRTVNTLIGIFRGALRMSWENGKLPSDLSFRAFKPLPVTIRPRILHLNRDECRLLLEKCRPEMKRLILGALYTGCRITELLRMTAKDVGREGYGVYVRPLKRHHPHFVFLPDEGMAFFLNLKKDKGEDERLFMRDNGRPWRGNHYGHFMRVAVRAAALPKDFSFHGLRHTYASQLIAAGAPILAVAEQLGHSSPASVMRTYGHLAPQVREAEVRQRFTKISSENSELAEKTKPELEALRKRVHGPSWRTYAQITDVSSREHEY